MTLPPPHYVAPSLDWVSAALASAELVFVHEDDSIQPLSQLYSGPYRVLSCQDNFFPLEIVSRTKTVSIDRLNPVIGPVFNLQLLLWCGWPSSACPCYRTPVLHFSPALAPVLSPVPAPVRDAETLWLWLDKFYLLLLYHHLLFDLRDDAGGEPWCSSKFLSATTPYCSVADHVYCRLHVSVIIIPMFILYPYQFKYIIQI